MFTAWECDVPWLQTFKPIFEHLQSIKHKTRVLYEVTWRQLCCRSLKHAYVIWIVFRTFTSPAQMKIKSTIHCLNSIHCSIWWVHLPHTLDLTYLFNQNAYFWAFLQCSVLSDMGLVIQTIYFVHTTWKIIHFSAVLDSIPNRQFKQFQSIRCGNLLFTLSPQQNALVDPSSSKSKKTCWLRIFNWASQVHNQARFPAQSNALINENGEFWPLMCLFKYCNCLFVTLFMYFFCKYVICLAIVFP